jgi:hypothetical protein
MSLPFPKPFFDPLMRERGHCEARARDAKAAFFVGKHGRRRFDGITFRLCARECPRTFQPMFLKQPMHITHAAH